MFSRNTTKFTSAGRSALERAEPLVEQTHGTMVHVEIERDPGAEQDVSRMSVVCHARIAKGAGQNAVVLSQASDSRPTAP